MCVWGGCCSELQPSSCAAERQTEPVHSIQHRNSSLFRLCSGNTAQQKSAAPGALHSPESFKAQPQPRAARRISSTYCRMSRGEQQRMEQEEGLRKKLGPWWGAGSGRSEEGHASHTAGWVRHAPSMHTLRCVRKHGAMPTQSKETCQSHTPAHPGLRCAAHCRSRDEHGNQAFSMQSHSQVSRAAHHTCFNCCTSCESRSFSRLSS